MTGDDAPDFSGKNFSTGEEINYVKDLKDKKVVLLNFWSIYCVSCKKEMPKLSDIYYRYKDRDIFFIAVNLDTSKRRLERYYNDKSNIPLYTTVMDSARVIAKAFNVSILPTTIIIDKTGKVRLYHIGYAPGDETLIEDTIVELTEQ